MVLSPCLGASPVKLSQMFVLNESYPTNPAHDRKTSLRDPVLIHLLLLEMPLYGSACSEDPVELVVVEDASMALVLEVLQLVEEGLR